MSESFDSAVTVRDIPEDIWKAAESVAAHVGLMIRVRPKSLMPCRLDDAAARDVIAQALLAERMKERERLRLIAAAMSGGK